MRMLMPSPTVFESTSRRDFLSLASRRGACRFPARPDRPSVAVRRRGRVRSASARAGRCRGRRCRHPAPASASRPPRHVVPQHGRVVPLGFFQSRGHDVLGHVVELVGELAFSGRPGLGKALDRSRAQAGAPPLSKASSSLNLSPSSPRSISKAPTAVLEVLGSARVLHHTVE